MRNVRIIAPWLLILSFTCSSASGQEAPPRVEVFAEGGGSFLTNGTAQIMTILCVPVCTPSECPPCPSGAVTSSFSKTGRLFTGARFRFTPHDAVEASYSYSPNHFSLQEGLLSPGPEATVSLGSYYNRVELISFNYIRYLSVRTRVQPFATVGLGANRFSGPPSAAPGFVASDNGYQFAWNYGGGADVVLQRHLALRLELRDYVTGQPSFITGTSHNIVPSAGIVFRLK